MCRRFIRAGSSRAVRLWRRVLGWGSVHRTQCDDRPARMSCAHPWHQQESSLLEKVVCNSRSQAPAWERQSGGSASDFSQISHTGRSEAREQSLAALLISHPLTNFRQNIRDLLHIRVALPQGLFLYRKRSLQQRFGLSIFLLMKVKGA